MSPCTATRLWRGLTPAAGTRARRFASCVVNAQCSTGNAQSSSHGNITGHPSSSHVLVPGGNPGGPGAPAGSDDAGKRVGRALLALQLEESRGHCDVRGKRSLFSEYAADELVCLGDLLPPGGGRDRWQRAVASGFSRYKELAPRQRANLVAEAQYLLSATEAGAPNAAAVAATATVAFGENNVSSLNVGKNLHKNHEDAATRARPGDDAGAGSASSLADFHSQPFSRETRKGAGGGKALIHVSNTWEHALAQDSRQRLEVSQVAGEKKSSGVDGQKTQNDLHFDHASLPHSEPGVGVVGSSATQTQGSEAWHALRASRLTASAFANALGFWRGGRLELWEEKLGLAAAFAGNDATEWGSGKEDTALGVYKQITNTQVSHLMFRVLSPDEAELWLGASPDGLIAGSITEPNGAGGARGGARRSAESGSDTTSSPPNPNSVQRAGVLEIKCPWNKGDPLNAKPYPVVPWYYIPQVQGLMAVFDRPYCDVFCYTVNNGCAIYRVERNAEYWAAMYSGLSDFWWQHVVPGKHALAAGTDFEKYRPLETTEMTTEMKQWSRRIAERAPKQIYGAEDVNR